MSITEPEPLKPKLNGIAAIITALSSLVSAVGVAVVIFISAQQAATLAKVEHIAKKQAVVLSQVEKQGNSASLELKRTTAAALRAVAIVSPSPANELKAKDAETLYEEARKQVEQNDK